MLSSLLSVPPPLSDSGSISDSGSTSGHDVSPSFPRFPHTRAQLSALARQYKPADSYDSDAEGDDLNRVSPTLVARVVSLLDHEHEDELKRLLKDTYSGLDDEAVSVPIFQLEVTMFILMSSSNRMS